MGKVVIKRLVWDEGNVIHIARHSVTPDEVEPVCQSDHAALDVKKGRIAVVGPTLTGRILFVVLDPEPEDGVYYPVTAHVADKKERERYRQEKGGEEANGQAT